MKLEDLSSSLGPDWSMAQSAPSDSEDADTVTDGETAARHSSGAALSIGQLGNTTLVDVTQPIVVGTLSAQVTTHSRACQNTATASDYIETVTNDIDDETERFAGVTIVKHNPDDNTLTIHTPDTTTTVTNAGMNNDGTLHPVYDVFCVKHAALATDDQLSAMQNNATEIAGVVYGLNTEFPDIVTDIDDDDITPLELYTVPESAVTNTASVDQ